MKLSYEVWFNRRYESNTKSAPKKPLTKKERDMLTQTCLKKCISAYISRMSASGLKSNLDSIDDLKSEAWIAMENIMDKFDKSKCGKITKYDEPGKDKPKSLEFYFTNYFYGRVNFMACDTRTVKQKRGMIGGTASSSDEITYNPADTASGPDAKYRYDSLDLLLLELDKQPEPVQVLFDQIFNQELPTDELKVIHPDYLKVRRALGSFINDFKTKHEGLLSEEVINFKKKKRSRKV
jgi:hypothetical protein